jgi:hypothetical protein
MFLCAYLRLGTFQRIFGRPLSLIFGQGYGCGPSPTEVHDAARYTSLSRRTACDGHYRQAMNLMNPIMMGGSGSALDTAKGPSFVRCFSVKLQIH